MEKDSGVGVREEEKDREAETEIRSTMSQKEFKGNYDMVVHYELKKYYSTDVLGGTDKYNMDYREHLFL